MKRAYVVLTACISTLVLLVAYRGWFGWTPLSAGDWSHHFPEEVANFFILPSSWMFWFHGGLGGNGVFLTGLETYFLATARMFYQLIGLSWAISERILWYIPFLLVGALASVYLVKTVLPTLNSWWLTPIIFLTNTYILMITGGGQMGIAMAYAVGPWVFAEWIRLYRAISLKSAVRLIFKQILMTGFSLACMVLFDPRVAYVLLIGVLIFGTVTALLDRVVDVRRTYFFVLPIVLTVFVHAFWVLPLVVFRVNPIESLGTAYNSITAVRFFSFSDFSHALVLLHPNWPENLFGKVYFLQPEFLGIPIVAFASLLFIRQKSDNRRQVISFALLGLTGVFLAKGANEPGGVVYEWLFSHIPGFNVFRDPTKFYLFIALAYSVLIPFSIEQLANKTKRSAKYVLICTVFIIFWMLTIRQAVLGQLSGTFTSHVVPSEYEELKNIINQPDFFRTFWVPRLQRYGFSTYMHPAVDAGSVLDTSTPSAMLAWIDSKEGINALADWSVKYVILPYDSQGEMFLDDRKYSEKQRIGFETALDTNPLLTKKLIPGISPKVSVYETLSHRDHLWLDNGSTGATVVWRMTFPTDYTVSISGLDRPAELIFSESYDPYWQLDIGGREIRSQKTKDSLNSFSLPALGSVSGTLQYVPQRYVRSGLVISVLTIIGAVVALAVLQ